MVFIFHLIRNPNKSAKWAFKASKFFQDVVNGIYEGVTTTFTELEYKGVVKRSLSNIHKMQVSPQQESAAALDFRNFIRNAGIMLLDADVLSIASISKVDLFSSTYSIMDNANPNSSPRYPNDQEPWRSIGGSDGITVNLAIRSKAKFIATCDLGYRNLNHSNLQPIIIQDNY